MYRKFKYSLRVSVLAWLFGSLALGDVLGYLSRQEAFEQSFEMVWSTVQESHWDDTFGGLDWQQVRGKYKPKLRKVKNRSELVGILQAMLDELNLSHFKILSSSVRPLDDYPRGGYVGLDLKYSDGRAYVVRVDPASPADLAGVRLGWRLKAIHRTSLSRLIKPFRRKDIPDKNVRFHTERYLNEVIQGGAGRRIRTDWYPPEGRAVKVHMEPEADVRDQSDPVGYLPSQSIEYEREMLEGDVLYLRFNYFLPELMPEIRDSIHSASSDATGLIIDLRSNVGGLSVMATGMTGLLVDEPTNLGTLVMKKGHITYQGYPQSKRFRGPVAVLVDGSSASTSEMLAAGLQEAGRARVFGETSLGESLPSLFKKLPSGDILQYAVGDFSTPEGYRIEKNGVVPDELITPTSEDLEMGLDLPLQKATEWILGLSLIKDDDAA